MRLAGQLAALVVVFAVTSAVALLLGADGLGVALGFGQIAFLAALAYLLLRR